MIPKTLHQTWKDDQIPARWRSFVQSFRRHNPDWSYRLWTDRQARELVAKERPQTLPTYDAYPYAILRADFLRYLVLYVHGGLYADMDVACLAPIAPLIERRGALLASEPETHAREHGLEALVCNAFMASEPGHPLWQAVLDELEERGPDCIGHRAVLELTGPMMLQRVIDHHRKNNRDLDDVEILAPEIVNPLPNRELEAVREAGEVGARLAERLRNRGAVALHVWSNSWVGTLGGELENPTPNAVPGFVFFQGLDSEGSDLANLGRTVTTAARACLDLPEAVAFNTDGFAKHRLRPRWRWHRQRDITGRQGLYVKRQHVKRWWRLPLPHVG